MSSLSTWLSHLSARSRLSREVFRDVLAETTALASGDASALTYAHLVESRTGFSPKDLVSATRDAVSDAAARAVACSLAASRNPLLLEKRLRSLGYDVDAAKPFIGSTPPSSSPFRTLGSFISGKFASGVDRVLAGGISIREKLADVVSAVHLPSLGKTAAVLALAGVLVAGSAPSPVAAKHAAGAGETFAATVSEFSGKLCSFLDELSNSATQRGAEFAERIIMERENAETVQETAPEASSFDDASPAFADSDPVELHAFSLDPDSGVDFETSRSDGSVSMTAKFADGSEWSGTSSIEGEKELVSRAAAGVLRAHGLPDDDMLVRYMAKNILPKGESFSPAEVVAKAVNNHARWAEGLGHAKRAAAGIAVADSIQKELSKYMETRDIDNIQEKSWEYSNLIMKYSGKTGIPPEIIASVICRESGGDETAISPTGAGLGLMQVNPIHLKDGGTASRVFGITTREELSDPEINVMVGTHLLKSAFQSKTHKRNPSARDYANANIREQAFIRYLGADKDGLRDSKEAKDYARGIERTMASIRKSTTSIKTAEADALKSHVIQAELPSIRREKGESRGHFLKRYNEVNNDIAL